MALFVRSQTQIRAVLSSATPDALLKELELRIVLGATLPVAVVGHVSTCSLVPPPSTT